MAAAEGNKFSVKYCTPLIHCLENLKKPWFFRQNARHLSPERKGKQNSGICFSFGVAMGEG
jgi:hypothetical protein